MGKSQAKSDLEEAIGRRDTDDETVATLRPSGKGEGDEWWRYVPLKFVRACPTANLDYSKLAQELSNHPLVQDVSEEVELFHGAATKFNTPSLPTVAV